MDFRCARCTEHRDDTIHNPNLVNSHDYVESAHEQLFRNTTLNEDGMIQVKRGGMKWGERLNSNIRPDGQDQRILDEDSMILETVEALINRARHRRGLPELDEQDGDEMFQLDCYLTDAAAGHIPTLADQEEYDHTEHVHMALPDDIHWGVNEKYEPTTFKPQGILYISSGRGFGKSDMLHRLAHSWAQEEKTLPVVGPYFDVASLHPEEVWINANQFPFGPFTQEEPIENHGDWEFERDNAKRNHPSNGDRMTQFDKTIFNAVADKAAKTEGIISNGYIEQPPHLHPTKPTREDLGLPPLTFGVDIDNDHFMTTGEVRTKSSTGGEKGVKPERYDLIPVEPLAEFARLLGKGAEKYADHNWRRGYEFSKSYQALQRHANAWWSGEDTDEEMGTSHMACVMFHASVLMELRNTHPEFDDRYKTSTKEEMKRARCYRFEDRKDTIPCGTCLPCLRDAENVERQRLNASAAASSRTVEIEYAGTNRQTVLKWLIDNWDAATPENVETMFTAMKLDVGSRIKIIEGGRIAWITSKEKFKEQ